MGLCISCFRVAWFVVRRSLLVLVLRYSCAAGFTISHHHHYYLQCLHLRTRWVLWRARMGSNKQEADDRARKKSLGRVKSYGVDLVEKIIKPFCTVEHRGTRVKVIYSFCKVRNLTLISRIISSPSRSLITTTYKHTFHHHHL